MSYVQLATSDSKDIGSKEQMRGFSTVMLCIDDSGNQVHLTMGMMDKGQLTDLVRISAPTGSAEILAVPMAALPVNQHPRVAVAPKPLVASAVAAPSGVLNPRRIPTVPHVPPRRQSTVSSVAATMPASETLKSLTDLTPKPVTSRNVRTSTVTHVFEADAVQALYSLNTVRTCSHVRTSNNPSAPTATPATPNAAPNAARVPVPTATLAVPTATLATPRKRGRPPTKQPDAPRKQKTTGRKQSTRSRSNCKRARKLDFAADKDSDDDFVYDH